MLFRSIRFFFLIFSLAFSSSLFAQDNYQQWVNDITSRLDKTAQLVQQGNTDDARTEVQMAINNSNFCDGDQKIHKSRKCLEGDCMLKRIKRLS
jgi:hypothetical protein